MLKLVLKSLGVVTPGHWTLLSEWTDDYVDPNPDPKPGLSK